MYAALDFAIDSDVKSSVVEVLWLCFKVLLGAAIANVDCQKIRCQYLSEASFGSLIMLCDMYISDLT